jgi:hypothetical protein
MGKDNHLVVSHKSVVFRNVGGHVLVKKLAVVAPQSWSFLLHILSQASQNVTVMVRVDRSVKRNKFSVNNPLHVEKKMSMLFIELWTCCAFFALGDCRNFHCDDCCFVSGS